ncbi:MAG TPA: YihY/virulence factor BrkB family protein [Terriglobales bacterium]|nr:YihY/virulence factor BrkB family protein [Terriglobales bacterium]
MRRWVRLVHAAVGAAVRDDLLDWAATLAFYFLFAFFPTVLLVASLLSVFQQQGLTANLVAALTRNLPREAASLVAEQLRHLLRQPVPGIISLDLLLVFYSASQAFSGLMAGLNAAYELPETRSWGRRLAVALLLTFSAGVFIALALAILLLGQHLLEIVAPALPAASALLRFWPLLRWGLTLAFMMLALLLLYRFAPSAAPARTGRLAAVAVAMLLWVLASALLAAYINRFAVYSAIYGSLGAVIALMLWFYFFALAILLGAEFHHAWLRQR